MKQTDQAARFLRLLFEQKNPDHYVLIWTLQGRHSKFFKDLSAAAEYAAGKRDVYTGVGLSPEDYGPQARCTAGNIAGITGLWADIDIYHPGAHAKANLPEDDNAALNILKTANARPTLIVHSGYGLQAWWLFKEPWIFADQAERNQAAALAHKWDQYIRQTAHSLGFDTDSVGDLARVLRIPGTLNGKIPDDPKHVKLRWGKEDRRYNPSSLSEIVSALDLPDEPTPTAAGDWSRGAEVSLIINPDRQPPIERYAELRRKSRRFVLTIEHQRPDLKDQSGSSYDMALAAISARHGWTDQEIADLLIFHQRKYPLDSAGQIRGVRGVRDRPRYFFTTIAKARRLCEPNENIQRLRQATATPAEPPTGEPADEPTAAGPQPTGPAAATPPEEPPERPADAPDPPEPAPAVDLLSELSKLLKVRIKRIIKLMSDPPLYTIETERGDVAIGEVQNLIEQRALRNRLANVGVYLTKRKEEDWEPIATSLLQCCTAVETTADATTNGAARAWIRDYLTETVIMDSIEEADRGQNPFIRDQQLNISSAGLRKFLIMNNGERQLTARDLTDALRKIGARPQTVYVESDGRRTSRSVWILPGKPEDHQ